MSGWCGSSFTALYYSSVQRCFKLWLKPDNVMTRWSQVQSIAQTRKWSMKNGQLQKHNILRSRGLQRESDVCLECKHFHLLTLAQLGNKLILETTARSRLIQTKLDVLLTAFVTDTQPWLFTNSHRICHTSKPRSSTCPPRQLFKSV